MRRYFWTDHYENELAPLRRYVAMHPGISAAKIKALPYEVRSSLDITSSSIEWKMRYLELLGDIRQVGRGKWVCVVPSSDTDLYDKYASRRT